MLELTAVSYLHISKNQIVSWEKQLYNPLILYWQQGYSNCLAIQNSEGLPLKKDGLPRGA